jgi:DNA helicase II / ATP-dependent DNA helicase PcrA
MDPLDGLNPEQRRAAETVRGPVCILAGAGSGKTTAITRRVAQQVRAGAFRADQILAVTFTDKAAGELRSRLAALAVSGVRASTFHAAALRQLRHFAPDEVRPILPSKALPVRRIANGLPGAFRFRAAADLATEIEWAKNRRIPPAAYRHAARDRDTPLPLDLMHGVYREYELRKEEEGLLDFEDLLQRAIALFERDERACETFRAQYCAFTVDEYQDVNLLQRSLLDLWLGERDELCVVGDDYQSIYAFTGAGPEHLLAMPSRFPHATVVRLEENYRSTPQVLALANTLVPRLGGAEKVLRSVRPDGPEPVVRPFLGPGEEGAALVERIRELDCPLEQVAILARTNARLTDFEELLHEAGLPYQGSSLLERDAARRIVRRLERSGTSAGDAVRAAALEAGWQPTLPPGLGEREVVRQTDLGRLVSLAADFEGTAEEFVVELRRRYETDARGVNLLTFHRAKGLEFEAVFIPCLRERELPSKLSRTDEAIAEERRLLYVGLTRAKRLLWVSWSGTPSRFVEELRGPGEHEPDSGVWEELRSWRLERAREDGVPPFVVFHDTVLRRIADARPASLAELSQISGVGPAKLERYGGELLAVVEG